MQTNKDILLEQKKRLKQELSMNPPKHREFEIKALLYQIDAQLRFMGVR